jgi:hypothetical protein
MDSEIDSAAIKRALGLVEASSGDGAHGQWLTGVRVAFDLTCTNKMWVEAERYRFFEFVSSQSTMHRITKFNLDEAYIDYVDPRCIEVIKEKVAQYNALEDTTTEEAKKLYLEILYSNPCGMYLTARMTTNYQQLKTIYQQRRNHRLPEWQTFCDWCETLPSFKLLCLGGYENENN